MHLPTPLITFFERKAREGWTGTITLNWKDGRVVAFEVAEKQRLDVHV